MSGGGLHDFGVCVVAWAVIYFLRALPFIFFGRDNGGERKWLKVVEKWLSPIVILFLTVYSFSILEWRAPSPYLAGAAVVAIQLLTRSSLAAIFGGTAVYMLLVG